MFSGEKPINRQKTTESAVIAAVTLNAKIVLFVFFCIKKSPPRENIFRTRGDKNRLEQWDAEATPQGKSLFVRTTTPRSYGTKTRDFLLCYYYDVILAQSYTKIKRYQKYKREKFTFSPFLLLFYFNCEKIRRVYVDSVDTDTHFTVVFGFILKAEVTAALNLFVDFIKLSANVYEYVKRVG